MSHFHLTESNVWKGVVQVEFWNTRHSGVETVRLLLLPHSKNLSCAYFVG